MRSKTAIRVERAGRRLVQAGFLLLFLFPLGVALYQKISYNQTSTLPSWLLWWDPAILLARGLRWNLPGLLLGPPLFLLALSFVFGRFFCGWICPIGTLADLVRPLAFWQNKRRKAPATRRNSWARYALLAAVATAGLFSIKYLGLLDPLVIFQRGTTLLAGNLRAPASAGLISLLFLAILGLELWRPRLWCRDLCPLGALLGLASRFSLLRRVVSPVRCTGCQNCARVCPMQAIDASGQKTDLSDCTLCLECDYACPRQGVAFQFAPTARTQPSIDPSRRQALTALAAGAAGLALAPLVELAPRQPVLRPPGALPEAEFVRTCIACQECVRVCPTGGLRPAVLESGLAGFGAPILSPRQGGCALNPSCPNLCAQVCPVGALRPVTKEEMKIGLARVHRESCLAWDQGARCLVCVEACLNSAAIAFQGRVTVDPNRCTGCGRCESGCPVPGSAIRVEPVASRQA